MQFEEMVRNLAKPGEDIIANLTPEKVHLWHMATGLATEAGEFLDAVKKYVIYNKPFDFEHHREELGDSEFYLEGARQAISAIIEKEFTRDDSLEANITKLAIGEKARYKSGKYTDQQAQDRADKDGAQT
jgi:NTP pyrophosphatase (non-canonical NTP hydrolase)